MTVRLISGAVYNYIGLSTDTKPSGVGVRAGATFYESDTQKEYIYDGANWTLK